MKRRIGVCILLLAVLFSILSVRMYNDKQTKLTHDSIVYALDSSEAYQCACDGSTLFQDYVDDVKEQRKITAQLLRIEEEEMAKVEDRAAYEISQMEKERIREELEEQRFWDSLEYLGVYDLTAYEWTGNPCANGNYPSVGYTVACNSLPLGTQLYIEGVGYRVVEDRGATWHSSNWIDLYLGDVSSCYDWGVRSCNVYIVR